jgi:hypothetical protein
MENLNELQKRLKGIDETHDSDSAIESKWLAFKFWAQDFMKIDENIEDTSINYSHKLERKNEILTKILKEGS